MRYQLPADLRTRYGDWSDDARRRLIEKTLDQPGEIADPLLKDWLLKVSFFEIRPAQSREVSIMAWRQWLAFALRYLEPLVTNKAKANQRLDVLFELNEGHEQVLAQIMIGAPEQYTAVLRLAFKEAIPQRGVDLTDFWRRQIAEIRCPGYGEEAVGKWSRVPITALIHAVNQDFASPFAQAADETLQMLRQNAERPSADYQATFAMYVERAQQARFAAYYGQALGYLNDFKRRMQVIDGYTRAARQASFVVMVPALLIALAVRGQPGGWLFPVGLILLVFAAFYGRLVDYVIDSFTWARAAQDTLEILMPVDDGTPTEKENI